MPIAWIYCFLFTVAAVRLILVGNIGLHLSYLSDNEICSVRVELLGHRFTWPTTSYLTSTFTCPVQSDNRILEQACPSLATSLLKNTQA